MDTFDVSNHLDDDPDYIVDERENRDRAGWTLYIGGWP